VILPSYLACCSLAADKEQSVLRPCARTGGRAITVLVANRAGVSAATITAMQSEASWVLGKSGISTTWIDCPFSSEPAEANSACGGPLGGTRFLLRITHDHLSPLGSVWDTGLGFAHVTSEGGGYATLLMDRVDDLARQQQLVSKGQILGHAAAHELGHLLMGSNSHSSRGLMRAKWKANELQDMAERRLLFSREEAERMRVRIAAILQR
jgi:hypothetical protein